MGTVLWLAVSCQQQEENSVPPELLLCPVPCGSVMPRGWIKEQMALDLKERLAGGYDRIWPNVSKNLFVKQERQQGMVKVKHGLEESEQRAWWAGEHEGYWKDAIVWLYNDFSNNTCTQNPDLQLDKLADRNSVFKKYTPHIVEGFYVPALCAKITGDKKYQQAAGNLKYKIAYHSSPAGNFVGSEWVHGEMGTGETWGEYCSLTESVP